MYDWIGSLSPVPEYFEIVDYKGSLVPLDMEAQSGIYNMRESSHSVNMTRSGIVAFQGFSAASEDDFEKLSLLKNKEINKLEDDEEFIVSRKNIFQDMINIYKNRSITKSKIHILFCDKIASDDGVTREAIFLFYNTLYPMFERANEKVPLSNIETEKLEIIGKIITHAFIIHGIFPVQICKSSFLNVL